MRSSKAQMIMIACFIFNQPAYLVRLKFSDIQFLFICNIGKYTYFNKETNRPCIFQYSDFLINFVVYLLSDSDST